ncbi:MAG: hypothetical protein P0Y55_08475 [Candidatus Cohnella colombiensis]|uniref:Uncharacterized protein n=1 Tax=Candidatus Cohnella colombiensis TaxID=3121368 RepID=A0AA95F1Q3_9BACL|nr:MAG: hypothetical protein P0Y55_08475 [Cohnella sp.]
MKRRITFAVKFDLLAKHFPANLLLLMFFLSFFCGLLFIKESSSQIFFAFPLMILVIYFFLIFMNYLRARRLLIYGQITKGILVKKMRTKFANQRAGNIEYYNKFYFYFRDQSGREVSFTQRSINGIEMKVNKETLIIYQPEDPQKAMAIDLISRMKLIVENNLVSFLYLNN